MPKINPRIKKTASSTRWLPQKLQQWLIGRIYELAGLITIALSLALVVAFTDYRPHDPSYNTAIDGYAYNALGTYGSHAADLTWQLFGRYNYLLTLAIGLWGYRLLTHRLVSSWAMRCVALLIGTILIGHGAFIIINLSTSPLVFIKNICNCSRLDCGVFAITNIPKVLSFFFSHSQVLVLAAILLVMCVIVGMSLLLYACCLSWRQLVVVLGIVATWFIRHLIKVAAVSYKLIANTLAHCGVMVRRQLHRKPSAQSSLSKTLAWIEKLLPSPMVVGSKNLNDNVATKPAKANTYINLPEAPPVKLSPLEIYTPPVQEAVKPQPNFPKQIDSYNLPPLDLVARPLNSTTPAPDTGLLRQNAAKLEAVLQDFGIKGEIVKIRPGPVVTLYELKPAAGIKSSRIISLAEDIARSMSAWSARVAVIPGHDTIGIELANADREIVYFYDTLTAKSFERSSAALTIILGKDIGGEVKVADLAKMPHLLIAGTTGSGKSVGINAIILSLLYRLSPKECKFIMIDPKMLELSVYDGIPHLLAPVVTDPKKAVVALKWVVREMEMRYKAMSQLGVRNIDGYNQQVNEAIAKQKPITRQIQVGFTPEGTPRFEEQIIAQAPLPYIVVVVDEMADLMLVAGKDIEAAVQRLAQMARAAGIHLIMATQRPSVDVITGTIKANFPTRLSYKVASKIDSRTMHGEQGAEMLLGQGDALYKGPDNAGLVRLHAPFVSDREVEMVVSFVKQQHPPEYVVGITEQDEDEGDTCFMGATGGGDKDDDLYRRAVEIVMQQGKASTSFIQRRLEIGYNRAANLMERMETEGIVSAPNHSGKRQILQRL